MPLASLHIGGGAHSDADSVGVGNRFISFRNRAAGRHPLRQRHRADPGCGPGLRPADAGGGRRLLGAVQPARAATPQKLDAALARRASVVDFILADIKDAKRRFGMDTEHARKLDGLLENWSQSEKSVRQPSRRRSP